MAVTNASTSALGRPRKPSSNGQVFSSFAIASASSPAQAALGRQQAHRGVLEQFGGDAAHAQQNGSAERVAVHAQDQFGSAAHHFLYEEALRPQAGLGLHLGRHRFEARSHLSRASG